MFVPERTRFLDFGIIGDHIINSMFKLSGIVKDVAQEQRVVTQISCAFEPRGVFQVDLNALQPSSPQRASKSISCKGEHAEYLYFVILQHEISPKVMRIILLSKKSTAGCCDTVHTAHVLAEALTVIGPGTVMS